MISEGSSAEHQGEHPYSRGPRCSPGLAGQDELLSGRTALAVLLTGDLAAGVTLGEDLSSPVHLACVRFMEACAEDFDLEGNEEQMSIVVQSWASGAAAILMLQQMGDFKVEFGNEPQDADDNVDDGGGE